MDKKYIALTFDDGPCEPMKEMIKKFADIGGKATFFVVGCRISDRHDDSMLYAIQNGCELGGHAYNHIHLQEIEDAALIKAHLIAPFNIVKARYGYDMSYSRLPYMTTNSLVYDVAKDLSMPLIGNSITSGDWLEDAKAENVAEAVIDQAFDGSICCLHVKQTTCDALDIILPELQKQGYEFVTVAELARIKGATLRYNEQIGSIN